MRKVTVLILVLAQVAFGLHYQSNPAFNNWINGSQQRPGTPQYPVNGSQPRPGAPQNPAFSNWLNRPGQPARPGQNPAFGNWLNGSQTRPGAPQNPAFNNWLNRPGSQPRPGTPQNPAFNNWLNRPGQPGTSQGRNAFTSWMNNSTITSSNLDNRLRNFLSQNRINVVIPDTNSCLRYSVANSSPRYQVTCALPNGQRFTQACFGSANCNMVTCKLAMCSRLRGGGLYRSAF